MRHVLWVDKNIVEKYRSSWTPVSHPLLLSGRAPPSSPPVSLATDHDDRLEKQKESGDTGVGRAEKNPVQHAQTNADSLSNRSKRPLDNTESTGRGKEKEKESRMTSSAIDDVKMRFLARKKAKTAVSG